MTTIKSKYFKISEEQLESKLFYLNDVHTKFNKDGETTQFVTLNILDTTKSVSLGGDILRKNANNEVTLRLKLTKEDGVTPRNYETYDSETKLNEPILVETIIDLLKQAGVQESEPLKYSKIDHIKTI